MTVGEELTVPGTRYGVLGPLRILGGRSEVPVTSMLQRKLLTAMLLEPRTVLSAGALEFILWGDSPPKTARKTLQTLIWRLRDLLGPGHIVTHPPGYLINVDDDDIDSIRFERLVEEADELLIRDSSAAYDMINEAIGLWRGAAIVEFSDEEFAMTEAHRLDELRLVATEIRFDALLDLGRHESAIPELEAFTERYPFREKPRDRLMTALYRSGRASDALAEYKRYRETLLDDLGLDPSPELQDLELRILNQDSTLGSVAPINPATTDSPTLAPIRSRLPQPPTLLGRQEELEQLAEMAGGPLTSVVGPGGVGKTSLVSVWADTQPVVSIVELAPIAQNGDLIAGLTQELGMDTQVGDPHRALIGRLSARGGILILDNCEHLLEPVREFVAELIRLAPEMRVVCTSRQRLGLPGEHVLNLEPLQLADDTGDPDDLMRNEAVRLFLDRAHRASSLLRISDRELPIVAEICSLVDGLPLAIELAAARAPVFGIAELASQIGKDISILEQGRGRHRSLPNVLDWSIGLLDRETRSVLASAARFEGSFRLDHLAEVHGRDHVMVNVGRLVDASLAYRSGNSHPARFKLHAPTRLHVRKAFGPSEEADRRFLEWGRGFVAEATESLGWPGEAGYRASLVSESANVTAATRAALARGERVIAFEIAEMLGKADLAGSPAIVGLLDEIAAAVQPGDGPMAVGALAAAARSSAVRGLTDVALQRAGRAEAAAAGQWHRGLYMATHARALVHYFTGNPGEAVELLQEIADDDRISAPERTIASLDRALVMGQAGDLENARAMAKATLEKSRAQCGDSMVAYGLFVLGTVALMDDPRAALSTLSSAIELSQLAQIGLINRIARASRVAALMLLDRDREALDEAHDLMSALIASGNRSLSLIRVVATLAMRAGDLERAALLAQAYESHTEAARYGVFVNATTQLDDLPAEFSAEEWTDLGKRAEMLTEREAVDLFFAVSGPSSRHA